VLFAPFREQHPEHVFLELRGIHVASQDFACLEQLAFQTRQRQAFGLLPGNRNGGEGERFVVISWGRILLLRCFGDRVGFAFDFRGDTRFKAPRDVLAIHAITPWDACLCNVCAQVCAFLQGRGGTFAQTLRCKANMVQKSWPRSISSAIAPYPGGVGTCSFLAFRLENS
jgi:hypothetical protein